MSNARHEKRQLIILRHNAAAHRNQHAIQRLLLIRPKTATFIVTYNGFTPAGEAAFQHAVDIWAQLITSPVPIRAQANWTALDPELLGSAGANVVFDFSNSGSGWANAKQASSPSS